MAEVGWDILKSLKIFSESYINRQAFQLYENVKNIKKTYNSIFIPKNQKKTYGELIEKNNISHRYKALKKFSNWYLHKLKSNDQ